MPSSVRRGAPSPTGRQLEVQIGLPPGWWQLPVGETSSPRDVADVVGGRISPAWEAERDGIIAMARAAAAEATGSGAVLAAQIGVVEGSETFSASLVVVIEVFIGIDDTDKLEAFLRAAETGTAAAGVDSVIERLAVGRVGPGLRRRWIGQGRDGMPMGSVRYYALVPGSDRTVIVDCASSSVEDTDGLIALFDDIVATLDITQTGQGPSEGGEAGSAEGAGR